MLVRAIYLDVAPYMRGRISPQKNYAAGVKPGDVMLGGAIGEVVQSNAKEYKPGDIVVTDFGFGWQELAVLRPSAVRRVDPQLAPLPYWMEAFGLNGMTAYFALIDAARMKPGDTVVISAAAGSVGQIAGQIAKLGGCRAVGITSSAEKIAWCRELGYDEVINYREEPDLPAAVAKACPQGVDVYIDNTGGRDTGCRDAEPRSPRPPRDRRLDQSRRQNSGSPISARGFTARPSSRARRYRDFSSAITSRVTPKRATGSRAGIATGC